MNTKDRLAHLFEGSGSDVLSEARRARGTPVPTASESKLVARKETCARQGRLPPRHNRPGRSRRLPPGQELARDWPVLDLGDRPVIEPARFRLTVGGAVERPLAWSWDEFLAQPQTEAVSDIHCVTAWSRLDARWQGVAVAHLLGQARPGSSARFVVLHGYDGYTTSLPLDRFAAEGAMLAHSCDGTPLNREHGGPVRAVIPELYFWKSAKWLRHIAILEKDAPGFWEARGYHAEGDPWKEQRYD